METIHNFDLFKKLIDSLNENKLCNYFYYSGNKKYTCEKPAHRFCFKDELLNIKNKKNNWLISCLSIEYDKVFDIDIIYPNDLTFCHYKKTTINLMNNIDNEKIHNFDLNDSKLLSFINTFWKYFNSEIFWKFPLSKKYTNFFPKI